MLSVLKQYGTLGLQDAQPQLPQQLLNDTIKFASQLTGIPEQDLQPDPKEQKQTHASTLFAASGGKGGADDQAGPAGPGRL